MDLSNSNWNTALTCLKERSVNFSKEEVNRLQLLVDKYKSVLMCKKTDISSTKQKEHAWCSIVQEFNSIGETPRTVKQLKYKFENMKRCAKKEACKERQEIIRTGGGKPPTLPPQSEKATDWLRSIMSGSIDGNEAVYDDDVMTANSISIPQQDAKINKILDNGDILPVHKKAKHDKLYIEYIDIDNFDENIPTEKIQNTELGGSIPILMDSNNESHNNNKAKSEAPIFDSTTPHSSLRKPVAPQLKRMIKKKQHMGNGNIVKNNLREKKLSVLEDLNNLELERIRQTIEQQKELHNQLMRHNEEKHKLHLIKLQLEIDFLQGKINGTMENKE